MSDLFTLILDSLLLSLSSYWGKYQIQTPGNKMVVLADLYCILHVNWLEQGVDRR
jgi:hypothetical protein